MKRLTRNQASIGALVSIAIVLLFNGHPDRLHGQTTNITSSGLNTAIHAYSSATFIDGGTRPGGGPNLFHSFGEFSIGTNHTALFRNLDANGSSYSGSAIQNIFGRVTGGNISSIFGTIDTATKFPQANLWLINPSGFLFGQTATLNVGGSVNISTADYLKMTDGKQFFVDPLKNSVLSMEPVAAFGFLGANPGGTITIQGGTVDHVSTLTFVGRDLNDSGGNMIRPGITLTGGTLSTSGAGVNLVSVKTAHDTVTGDEIIIEDLSPASGKGFSALGTVRLDSGGTLKTIATAGNAGSIFVRARDFVMDHGGIDARTLEGGGPQPSSKRGGDIDIHASEVRLSNGTIAGPFHNQLDREAAIFAGENETDVLGTIVTNNTGNITIRAMDTLFNNVLMRSQNVERAGPTAAGLGDIRIQGNSGPNSLAHHVVISDSRIQAVGEDHTAFAASGGSVSIEAESITLGPHSSILNITGNGISLYGKDSISSLGDNSLVSGSLGRYSPGSIVLGSDVRVSLGPAVPRKADGISSGDYVWVSSEPLSGVTSTPIGAPSISIKAPIIDLLDANLQNFAVPPISTGPINLFGNRILINNSSIFSSSLGGGSSAGDIEIAGFKAGTRAQTISVKDTFLVAIVNPLDPPYSQLGRSGNIRLNGEVITVDGSSIDVAHFGQGESGSIRVDSGQFHIVNSFLDSITTGIDVPPSDQSMGAKAAPGGNIEVNAIGTIDIGQSNIRASSSGDGKAGNITLSSTGIMNIRETSIDSSAGNVDAGSITLSSGQNIHLNYTDLTTSALQTSGGNITLTAPGLITLINSNLASSVQGEKGSNGGNITIDPIAVVIQNSQISATANAGAGGVINVAASKSVLIDPNSRLDASAGPAGISGRVNINAPIQVLSGTLVPLKMAYSQPALSSDRCAADPQGRFSSFVHTGRDGMPAIPGAYTPSPLFVLDQLMANSLGRQLPNLTAARLGLNSLSATWFQFRSACRS